MVSGINSPLAIIPLISGLWSNNEDIVTALDRPLDSRMKGVLTPLPDPGAPLSQTISFGVWSSCMKLSVTSANYVSIWTRSRRSRRHVHYNVLWHVHYTVLSLEVIAVEDLLLWTANISTVKRSHPRMNFHMAPPEVNAQLQLSVTMAHCTSRFWTAPT